jgi:hypothetical protein
MTVTSCHTKACFDAWIRCEDLLTHLAQMQKSFSKKIMKVVDECALICMSTFHALKSQSVNAGRYAMLCIGICEECADICDELNEESCKHCARVCRQCSDIISGLFPLSFLDSRDT